ncbi:MAG: benzoylformate decarboxylase [Beijerinckiaceae bacterium]
MTRAPKNKDITVRESALGLLRSFGIETIFGNPGSTELPLFRAFPSDFRYILGLQESVVVAMADGYAQATRNAAFVNLHSAAGVGHALGNIFTAFRNATPLIITAGQQARSILPFDPFLFAQQATEFPKPYVKWANEPACAADVPQALARAYHIAMQPPCGPVFLSIPVDDWDEIAAPVAVRRVSRALRADPEALTAIIAALDRAKRPAFVAGAEIDRDQAWDEIVALAERHQARVWTSPHAARASFPQNHPLFAGFLPPARAGIRECLAGHDLILVIGAPVFTYHVEGDGPHIPEGATLYHLTDDSVAASSSPVGNTVVTSVRLGLRDLIERSQPPKRKPPALRPERPALKPTHPMSAEFVMQTIATERPADSIIVEEAPTARQPMQGYLPFDRPDSFYTMASGGLGFSLGAAIGIALAKRGKRRIIALVGDGSAMYGIQGLWSAAQNRLPIVFIILNNRRYAALEDFAEHFSMERTVGTQLPGIDFCALAQGQGVNARRVNRAEELVPALRSALGQDEEPILLEVAIA